MVHSRNHLIQLPDTQPYSIVNQVLFGPYLARAEELINGFNHDNGHTNTYPDYKTVRNMDLILYLHLCAARHYYLQALIT